MKPLVISMSMFFVLLFSIMMSSNNSHMPGVNNNSPLVCPPAEMTGHVYYGGPFNGSNDIYKNCTPQSIGVGVENILVRATVLSTGQIFEDETNNTGQFTMAAPPVGAIRMGCIYEDGNSFPVMNGIDAFDMIEISKHMQKIESLCPMGRIAADFDRSGIIDTSDLYLMSAYYIGLEDPTTYPYDPWIFIPNALNFPSLIHPDPEHVSNYWNQDYPDYADLANGEKYYPFISVLNVQNHPYYYQQYPGESSWIGKIGYWDYNEPNEDCGLINYGFWLVKSGDINRSANLNFLPNPTSPIPPGQNNSTTIATPMEYVIAPINNIELKNSITTQSFVSGQTIKAKLKIKSSQSISALQLGARLDTEYFEIISISTGNNKVEKELKGLINDKTEELAMGNVRLIWLTNDLINGTDVYNETTIANLQVKLKKKLPAGVTGITLAPDLLETEFISNNQKLNADDIEIKFELSTPK